MEQRLLFRWEELLAKEAIVDQIAAEFGGEDPLKPVSRAGLQHGREIGEKLAHELRARGAAWTFQLRPTMRCESCGRCWSERARLPQYLKASHTIDT